MELLYRLNFYSWLLLIRNILLLVYRNNWFMSVNFVFCNSMVNSNSFLCQVCRSPYKIISSANKDIFKNFIFIWMTFISFYCLLALAGLLIIMLKKSGESGHPILVLILEKIFQTFTIEYDTSCGVVIYYIEICSFNS